MHGILHASFTTGSCNRGVFPVYMSKTTTQFYMFGER